MKSDGPGAGLIEVVVLAAGRSTRFGGQKLLADLSGEPMIRRTVSGLLRSKADRVRVVVGAGGADVRSALAGLRVAFTENPDPARGMGTSIAAGTGSVEADTAAIVIAMGDQPTVPADLIDALIDAFRSGAGEIVVPEFEGVPGPPVLFGRRFFPALADLEGDSGGRGIIAANAGRVCVLAMDGRAPPDIDTKEDHEAVSGNP